MITGLIIFHVIVCLLLTLVVLLQFGKGAESGAFLGGQGGSQAVFTSSQSGNFFSKFTTFLAICFMLNSIAISTFKSKESEKSVLDSAQGVETTAPLNMDEAVNKNELKQDSKNKNNSTK